MKVKFNNPIMVGPIANQQPVHEMEIITVAFNLAPYTGHGGIASITLRDLTTNYQEHLIIEDTADDKSILEFWNKLSVNSIDGKKWMQHIVERLIKDQKLPQGVIE